MFSVEFVQNNLTTHNIGSTLIYNPVTNSTNDDAWKLVEDNRFTEGSVIVADEQTQGRGRQNRKWFTTSGCHLAFSVILTPELSQDRLGLISILSSVATADGINKFIELPVRLKWPNDVLVENKKIAGILIESRKIQNTLITVIGIGININESALDFPEEIRQSTTSLKLVTGCEFSREDVLISVLRSIEDNYLNEMDRICVKWLKLCGHVNHQTEFHLPRSTVSGKFLGITELGHARVTINGVEKIYSSGEIIT